MKDYENVVDCDRCDLAAVRVFTPLAMVKVAADVRYDSPIDGAPITSLSDYEWVLELAYQVQLNPWWYVQPDIQCIVHPGGSADNPASCVLGIRSGWVF